MKPKYLIAILVVIAVLTIAGCQEAKDSLPANPAPEQGGNGEDASSASTPPAEAAPNATPPAEVNPEADITITAAELLAHNTEDDCWVVYQSNVYDISSFVPLHPGGPAKIIPHCGKVSLEEKATNKHGASFIAEKFLSFVLVGPYAG